MIIKLNKELPFTPFYRKGYTRSSGGKRMIFRRREPRRIFLPPSSLASLLFPDKLLERLDGLEICDIKGHNGEQVLDFDGDFILVPNAERTEAYRGRVLESAPRLAYDSHSRPLVRVGDSYHDYSGEKLDNVSEGDYIVGMNLARIYAEHLGIWNFSTLIGNGTLDWFEKPPIARSARVPKWIPKEDLVKDTALRDTKVYRVQDIHNLLP